MMVNATTSYLKGIVQQRIRHGKSNTSVEVEGEVSYHNSRCSRLESASTAIFAEPRYALRVTADTQDNKCRVISDANT